MFFNLLARVLIVDKFTECIFYAMWAVCRSDSSGVGRGGHAAEHRTVNQGDGSSIPPIAVTKLRQFRSSHI